MAEIITHEVTPKRFKRTKTVVPEVNSTDIAYIKTYQVIWFILALVEIIIGFRLLLKLFGAGTASGFTNFIYALSYPFVAPFFGIFPTGVGPSGSVLEWSSLTAMVVYAVLAWIIIYLIKLLRPGKTITTTSETIEDGSDLIEG